jgi:cytochrome c peroxidase
MSAPLVSRQFARAAVRTGARNTFVTSARQAFQRSGRRFNSSEAASETPKPLPPSSGSSSWIYITGALVAGGAGYYLYSQGASPSTKNFVAKKEDYQKVYNEIASRLEEKEDYDDGSYGPVLVRLAWHASGTYDKDSKTGGSNGATMRFSPEADHGANAGLKHARDFLEPVKGKWAAPIQLSLELNNSERC